VVAGADDVLEGRDDEELDADGVHPGGEIADGLLVGPSDGEDHGLGAGLHHHALEVQPGPDHAGPGDVEVALGGVVIEEADHAVRGVRGGADELGHLGADEAGPVHEDGGLLHGTGGGAVVEVGAVEPAEAGHEEEGGRRDGEGDAPGVLGGGQRETHEQDQRDHRHGGGEPVGLVEAAHLVVAAVEAGEEPEAHLECARTAGVEQGRLPGLIAEGEVEPRPDERERGQEPDPHVPGRN